VSPDGFGKQFLGFSKTLFFNISRGMDELPAEYSQTDFEIFAVFWFFYWGILLFPIGLLVHCVERKKGILPHTFTISFLIVVMIGSYMVPQSGMTYFMLPHAIYMLIRNYIKAKKELVAN
jgi:hypothetical protein